MRLTWVRCEISEGAWYLDDLDIERTGPMSQHTGFVIIRSKAGYEVHYMQHLATLETLEDAQRYAVVAYQLGGYET